MGLVMSASSSCPGCRRRDAQIEQLQARLAQVETENGRLRRELESTRREQARQANRFRRRTLKKRRKKPGRKPGHPAAVRPTPKPDRVIDVPLRSREKITWSICALARSYDVIPFSMKSAWR